MCGIFGFAASTPMSIDYIRSATDIIKHRGPDDGGFAIWKDLESPPFEYEEGKAIPSSTAIFGLGHRRLSILDVSPLGHQPMQYAQGRYWISYNGEIYNYLELRAELQTLGHKFKSRSDTEVILAAYAQWGTECQSRLNGMWAFAIYDGDEKKLFLSRDRFGIKPLYYWISPEGHFFFGSEIKQFTTLAQWSATLNMQRAYDFLAWGILDNTDETMFDGVFHVPAGHCMEASVKNGITHKNGRIPLYQWYFLPEGQKENQSFEQDAAQFRKLLKESVQLQMRSDVPIGSCLSGGLDSSSIVCLMSEILPDNSLKNLKTFSALSNSETYSEKKWIDIVVKKTSAIPSHVEPNPEDLFKNLQKITWHQEEPFGSTSIFAQWSVFQLANKQNTRVILDGQGADEQLFGYHSTIGIRFWSLFRTGRWRQLVREFYAMHKIHGYSVPVLCARFIDNALPEYLRMTMRKIIGKATTHPDWITTNIEHIKFTSPIQKQRTIHDFCRSQILHTNLPMLLHWEDRNSMAHSIESRVPFLDHRLVEFSMSLPDDHKFLDGITKRVLRSAMSGILPDAIRDRVDKIGFATAESSWMKEEASVYFRDKMNTAIANAGGILNTKAADLLEDVIAEKKSFTPALWRIISFGQWIETFSVQIKKN